MPPIRSGTTTERVIRTSILTAMLVTYSIWSFKDGYFSYSRHNIPSLVQSLHVPPDPETVAINPAVRHAAAEELNARVTGGLTVDEVHARLGESGIREGETEYHFGPGGMTRVEVAGNRVIRVEWVDGEHDETDLVFQKVIGLITGVLGVLALLQLARVLLTRIELTEEGLKVSWQGGLKFGGSPRIPIEAITRLGTEEFRKKGWIDVYYTLGGREGKTSINDYVHKAFPDVVHAICTRRGFPDPILAEQAEKAAKEREE